MRDVFELRPFAKAIGLIEKNLTENATPATDSIALPGAGESRTYASQADSSIPTPSETTPVAINAAARKIQRGWKAAKLAYKFTTEGYDCYTGKFPDSLHAAMFGKTIAGTTTKDFPPYHPESEGGPSYHRENILWHITQQSPLLTKLLQSKGITPTDDIAYIPIRKSAHIPPAEILAQSGLTEVSTTAYEDERIIVISCPHEYYQHGTAATHAIFRLGMQASQWDIATSAFLPASTDESTRYHYVPLEAFKQSTIVTRLKRLSLDISLPTHPLLLALHNLIIHLPESFDLQQASLGRLEAMLPSLLQAKHMNYKSISNAIYLVLHEVALHAADNLALKEPSPSFIEMIMQSICVAKQQLGYSHEEFAAHKNLMCTATMTNSGATAFAIGLNLAKKMQGALNNPPTSRAASAMYYEFGPYYTNNPFEPYQHGTDIYMVNLAPLITRDGVLTMPPLNEALSTIFSAHGYPKTNPITIVVDATATQDKAMGLCPEYRKLIDDGLLNVIITRSHQKFGLLHADNVQSGEVTVFCSKKSFAASTIRAFNRAAENDYNSSVDQQTTAYIQKTCPDSLDMVAARHYHNGRILQRDMAALRLQPYGAHGNSPSDNLFVFAFEDFNPDLFKASGALLHARDSYGFSSTTYSSIESGRRITPSASDNIDITIDSMKLYFGTVYTRPGDPVQSYTPPLKAVLLQLIKKPGDWTPAQQIAVLALLRSHTQRLLSYPRHLRQYDCSQVLLVAQKLQQQGSVVRGRTEMQLLLLDTYKIKKAMRITLTNKNLAAYLKAIDTSIKAGYETNEANHPPQTRAAISLVYEHNKIFLTEEVYDKLANDENFVAHTNKLFELSVEFVPGFLTNRQMQRAISFLLSADLDSEINTATLSIVLDPSNQNILVALHQYASQSLSEVDKAALKTLTHTLVNTMLTVSNPIDRREEIKQSMTSWAEEKKTRTRIGMFASPSSKRKACMTKIDMSLSTLSTDETHRSRRLSP
ncbi:MAG: hypothetical protein P1U63_01200 [Coxiellaceae bacterium]|nr:hypothetical protein [Coxiellaceae bacterium]